MLETLAGFGLKPSDAHVYVFLAKKGPHTEKDLCNILTMPKHQVYQCLRNLENRGIVNATLERPAQFTAAPFEKVLDLLTKAKLEEAERTRQDKDEALSDWQSLMNEAPPE